MRLQAGGLVRVISPRALLVICFVQSRTKPWRILNGFRKIWTLNDKTKVLVSLALPAIDGDYYSLSDTFKANMPHLVEDHAGVRQCKVAMRIVFVESSTFSVTTAQCPYHQETRKQDLPS